MSDKSEKRALEGQQAPTAASAAALDLKLTAMAAIWTERAGINERQGQSDLASAALTIAWFCKFLSECSVEKLPEFIKEANTLRKKIEASERHRTMCVEHGLSDAAIDATYEIQSMEKRLLSILTSLDKRDET